MDPLGYTNPHVMNPFNLQDFNGLSAFGNAQQLFSMKVFG